MRNDKSPYNKTYLIQGLNALMKRFLMIFFIIGASLDASYSEASTTGSFNVSLTILNPVSCLYKTDNMICYNSNGEKNKDYKIEKDMNSHSMLITF